MKYVSIVGYSVLAINLCTPALAGHGNALSGGWDGTVGGGSGRPVSGSAPASPAPSLASSGIFGGGLFDLSPGPQANGNTGGAPSPEIDAALGLILAGGTVAFLRRRRAGAAKPQA